MDKTVIALRALIGGDDVKKRQEVADAIDANEQYLYQIARGIPLPSGKPRTVGRQLREKLDAKFPGWLDASTDEAPVAAATAEPPAPTLAQALEVLGIELARELPDDVREDLADALAKLARRKGTHRDQLEVARLLTTTPSSDTATPEPRVANATRR